ncbi:hypothetical protein Bca52824_053879 [Brassica carinata]|uniref:Uncharacterized protein n=1 Tax=Brassica carinata TaxID=52824 RepID=A0A8X7ULB5_BRACI|nr:hypothetical protein Bca52824_053879 [Brassica carinata]
MKYEDFLRIVCDDYNISEVKAVEFAYMLPKRISEQIPSNTPPIFLSNDRQPASFITLFKTDVMCIYLSLTANKGLHDVNRNQKRVVRENSAADFGSFGSVQYDTMKPSHETMKPSLETMKPLQLRKSKTIKSGEIFSANRALIMKLRKLSVIERFDFSI